MSSESASIKDLSIITVVRNGIDAIVSTIESVHAEKTPRMEYLVIDGLSTDGTLDVVRRYPATVDQLISERDRGIYDAMNKGAGLATAEWLLFLNAGDSLRPGMIQQMLELATRSNPPPDVLCGKVAMVDGAGQSLHYTHPVQRGNVARLLRENCVAHQGTLMRRSLLDRHGGFSLDYTIMGDYEYWIRLLKAGARLQFTDLVVANFIANGVSSQRDNFLLAQWERLQVLVRHGHLTPGEAARQHRWRSAVFKAKSAIRALVGSRLSRMLSLARSRRA